MGTRLLLVGDFASDWSAVRQLYGRLGIPAEEMRELVYEETQTRRDPLVFTLAIVEISTSGARWRSVPARLKAQCPSGKVFCLFCGKPVLSMRQHVEAMGMQCLFMAESEPKTQDDILERTRPIITPVAAPA